MSKPARDTRHEARRIIDRASVESGGFADSLFVRAANAVWPQPAAGEDPAELWGRRVGRSLGVVVAILHMAFTMLLVGSLALVWRVVLFGPGDTDLVQALVDRIANDEGADSAVNDQQIIEQAGNLFDFHCDDIFYFNKGRLYANYLLLRELGRDFDAVIKEKGLTNAWTGMVETFRIAAQLEPWIVWNGYPDALLIPNHLAAQGFYLLRARTQLREISAILLK